MQDTSVASKNRGSPPRGERTKFCPASFSLKDRADGVREFETEDGSKFLIAISARFNLSSPFPTSSSCSLISFIHKGCVQSPVATSPIPFRFVHAQICGNTI